MGTKETRAQRGRRRGVELTRLIVAQLRDRRVTLGLSQSAVAIAVGWSQQHYSRFEANRLDDLGLTQISTIAAVLGLQPSLALHPAGPALRDEGHQALIGRFTRILSPAWHVAREVPFPNPGDPRYWDLMLRLTGFRLGVEAETRIRDLQALVRRMRERARDGGADALLLILSDSGHNRGLVEDLRIALGEEFRTAPSDVRDALRAGLPHFGSGVILL